jgi:hypothetical protein
MPETAEPAGGLEVERIDANPELMDWADAAALEQRCAHVHGERHHHGGAPGAFGIRLGTGEDRPAR